MQLCLARHVHRSPRCGMSNCRCDTPNSFHTLYYSRTIERVYHCLLRSRMGGLPVSEGYTNSVWRLHQERKNSLFLCPCDKTPWQELKEGFMLAYFSRYLHHGGEVKAAGAWNTWSYYIYHQKRAMNAFCHSAPFLYLCSPESPPKDADTHSEWESPTQLTQSR